MARVGEHAEAVWKSVKRMPLLEANFWSVGVDISPPKGEMSELAIEFSLQGWRKLQSKIISNYNQEIGSFRHGDMVFKSILLSTALIYTRAFDMYI